MRGRRRGSFASRSPPPLGRRKEPCRASTDRGPPRSMQDAPIARATTNEHHEQPKRRKRVSPPEPPALGRRTFLPGATSHWTCITAHPSKRRSKSGDVRRWRNGAFRGAGTQPHLTVRPRTGPGAPRTASSAGGDKALSMGGRDAPRHTGGDRRARSRVAASTRRVGASSSSRLLFSRSAGDIPRCDES